MPITKYRFGSWAPDSGDYFADESGVINVTEVTGLAPKENGWRTFPTFYPVSGSVINPPVADSPRTSTLFSVTGYDASDVPSNIIIRGYDNTSATVDCLIQATGTTRGRAGGYSTSGRYGWKFAQFGDKVIATNGVDAIQRSVISGTNIGTFAKNNDLTGTPTAADPRAKFVEVFKGHLFIGNFDLTAGTTGAETFGGAFGPLGAQAYREGIWYSGLDNERRFGSPDVTPAILGSDYRLFYDNFGAVTGLKSCSNYMVICREKAVQILTGPPFNVESLSGSIGTTYFNSLTACGQNVYLWTRKGPCVIINGSEVKYLGVGRVTRYIEEIASSMYGLEKYVFGASSIDGNYVGWTIRTPFSNPTKFTSILIYSISNDEFTLHTETGFRHIGPMTSVSLDTTIGVDYFNTFLDGFYLSADSEYYNATTLKVGASSLDTAYFVPRGASRSISSMGGIGSVSFGAAGVPLSSIKTAFFNIQSADMTPQSFRIVKFRPIIWNEPRPGSVGNMGNTSDPLFSKVRIYSRSKYTTTDRTTAETADAASYTEYEYSNDSTNESGFIDTSDSPSGEMFAIELFIENDDTARLLYGFEISFIPEGGYTTGKGTYT